MAKWWSNQRGLPETVTDERQSKTNDEWNALLSRVPRSEWKTEQTIRARRIAVLDQDGLVAFVDILKGVAEFNHMRRDFRSVYSRDLIGWLEIE